jgi:hypothetical protein
MTMLTTEMRVRLHTWRHDGRDQAGTITWVYPSGDVAVRWDDGRITSEDPRDVKAEAA